MRFAGFWLAPTQARAPNWFLIKLCSRLCAAPWISSGWLFSAAGPAVQFSAAGYEALDLAMSPNSFAVHGVHKLQSMEIWVSVQELMHSFAGGGDARHLGHAETECACTGMSASV